MNCYGADARLDHTHPRPHTHDPHRNLFVHLPGCMSHLPQLRRLAANNNQLSEIDARFAQPGGLQRLQTLTLRANVLVNDGNLSVPAGLPALAELDVSVNPLETIPPSLALEVPTLGVLLFGTIKPRARCHTL